MLRFSPTDLLDNHPVLLSATKSVVSCYSSNWKLIHTDKEQDGVDGLHGSFWLEKVKLLIFVPIDGMTSLQQELPMIAGSQDSASGNILSVAT